MRITKQLLVILLFLVACNNKDKAPEPDIAFENRQWQIKEGKNYSYRKRMINDLLANHTWTGLTKDSIIRKLGEPDVVEEDIFMLYHYQQKFVGSMVWSTQSFVVQLDSNNLVKLARTN